jgi:CSLREA domain-containing protein
MKKQGLFRLVIGSVMLFAAAFTLSTATGVDTTQQASFPEIFVVNTTFDAGTGADDAFPGDGQCETAVGNGVCTLRAAIEETNAHAGGDGIFFSIPTADPGYSNGMWTISAIKALPDIRDSVNISGPGANKLTVQHSPSSAPSLLFNVTTTGTVNFSGMTIARCQAPNDGSAGSGLRNYGGGTVNVSKCTFLNDHITAIHNRGTMNITGSTITGGSTASNGGGIINNGMLTVTNTTVSGNLARIGGGIWNNGTMNVIGCTISGNEAYSDSNSNGGGIYNEITTGMSNVTSCTIIGNIASGAGGGIYNGAIMSVTNNTVSGNSSYTGSAIDVGPYGGTVLNIKSTIVALNTNNNYPFGGPDVGGFFTSFGFNLIGKTDGSTGFNAATDLTGTNAAPLNPKLGPLKDNGGPTYTCALLSGSPAIDKGTSNGLTGKLTTDQRGVGYVRTINKSVANATGGDGTDIGAFELGAQIKAVSRKRHGTAGSFDISLPLFGPKLGVECRKGGSSKTFMVVATFPTAVTVGSASVTPDPKAPGATGSVSSASVSGHVVTVNLTAVSNAQTILLDLFDVSDGTNTNDASVPMGVLFGDTNNNKAVSSTDVTLTQSKVGQALSAANFREDVDINGSINSTDVQTVQSKVGTKLP